MTGADIRLSDEQVDLVHRLQQGKFGDVNFNEYEVFCSGFPLCWCWIQHRSDSNRICHLNICSLVCENLLKRTSR